MVLSSPEIGGSFSTKLQKNHFNQDYYQNNIPITRKYLYSSRFFNWKESDKLKSSYNLWSLAEHLNGKIMKLSDNQLPNDVRTRATEVLSSTCCIYFYYDVKDYVGDNLPGTVYGLSPGTIQKYISDYLTKYYGIWNPPFMHHIV